MHICRCNRLFSLVAIATLLGTFLAGSAIVHAQDSLTAPLSDAAVPAQPGDGAPAQSQIEVNPTAPHYC